MARRCTSALSCAATLRDQKLQHAGRLASMGEMASTLAHELNQPLMALMGFTSSARNYARQKNQEMLETSLDDAQGEVERAAEIVRRVRRFVKLQTLGTEACDIGEIVAQVLALLRSEIRAQGTRVVTRMQAQLSAVQGDRVLLQQVVLNLVTNAVQAMSDMPVAGRLLEIDMRTVETHRARGHQKLRVDNPAELDRRMRDMDR